MRGGIDYSKWDAFDAGSSSEDDEEQHKPRVTQLDQPGTVTRSSDGTITFAPSDQVHHAGERSVEKPEKKGKKQQDLTLQGGEFRDSLYNSHVRWSQDRENVVIRIAYNSQKIRAKDVTVKVNGALPYSQRQAAVSGTTTCTLQVQGKLTATSEKCCLLKGQMPHAVHLPAPDVDEEGEDEAEVDWEIQTLESCPCDDASEETKMICVTLHKAVPMAGMTVWWSQPLIHCPKIDVSKFTGQERKSEDWKEAWDEAHRLFREKIQAGKVQPPL